MKKMFLAASTFLLASSLSMAQTDYVGSLSRSEKREESKQQRKERREEHKELRKERRSEARNEVSNIMKDNFSRDFPDARNPTFQKTKNFDEVSFLSGRKRLRAYYDADANLVGTTEVKKLSDLPAKAQQEIVKKYADYRVVKVIRFDDNEENDTDMILYDQSFDDADNYFVEIKNGTNTKILRVDDEGWVYFFKDMK